ncbi:hypothetical protein F4861DRAFT_512336 [Xylaria intraflava]|nr:hypothetical protein F4861DRAFT_512336 [Xylaria intraflava]
MANTHQILQWIKTTESSRASSDCAGPLPESHVHSDDGNDNTVGEVDRPPKRIRNESPTTEDGFLYAYHTEGPSELRTTPMADQSTPTRRGKRLNDNDQTPTQRSRRQRHQKRPRSDTKTQGYLLTLKTPVHVLPWNFGAFSQLPGFQDIQDLYMSVGMNQLKRGVVPGEIHELFTTLYTETHGLKPFPEHFRPPDSSAGIDVYGFTVHDHAKIELALLQDVQREASLSKTYKRHECGWIMNVYAPLLRHVFKDDIRPEAVMTATMEGGSIPVKQTAGAETAEIDSLSDFCVTVSASSATSMSSVNPAHVHSRSDVKIVDYALVMDLPRDSTLHKTIVDLIARVCGGGRLHVNQTAYQAIQNDIIAVSIEVKAESSAVDPLVQLGFWIAAWYKRMWSLRRELFASKVTGIHDEQLLLRLRNQEQQKRLVTVPLIAIVGHQWDMYFACFEAARITLHGPVKMGSTESILEVYALVTSLRAVAEWVRTVFKKAMEDWFMCEDEGNR